MWATTLKHVHIGTLNMFKLTGSTDENTSMPNRGFSSLTITAFVKNRYLQPSLFVVNYYQSIFIFLFM